MDVQHRLPLLVRHFVERSVPGEAGVIYQRVERSKAGLGTLRQAAVELPVRHAALERERFAATGPDLGHRVFERLSVKVAH